MDRRPTHTASRCGKSLLADDFLDGNFLSNDGRVPVTLLQTNACSPLATNAIGKQYLGQFLLRFVQAAAFGRYDHRLRSVHRAAAAIPDAGRRTWLYPRAVAASLWSTAPFLLNNSVGRFDPSPSVEARMASFQDSITKMLWPEKREKDAVLGDKVPGVIDRTTVTSWLRIPTGYLPDVIKLRADVLNLGCPGLRSGGIEIGPIPAGTPVDLLANFDPLPPPGSLRERLAHDKAVVKAVATAGPRPEDAAAGRQRRAGAAGFRQCRRAVVRAQQMPGLCRQSRPLLRVAAQRRGQEALIAFLKTF